MPGTGGSCLARGPPVRATASEGQSDEVWRTPSPLPTNTSVARKVLRLGVLVVLAMLLAVPALASAAAGARKGRKGAVANAPNTLSAIALDSGHVKLQWSAVAGATSYRVLRGGLAVGQTGATTYSDTLLWPRTSYSYEVDALTPLDVRITAFTGRATTPALPGAGFPRPFSATSVWNTPVGATPPATDADALGAYFRSHVVNPNMTLRSWGVAVAETHPTDTPVPVPCTTYLDCTLGAFGSIPIPATAVADPASDGHLAVVDPSSQREWDMWQARRTGAAWSASAGAALDMSGNAVAPAGTASGDAANFPLLGGLVRPEEILQGHIDHALVFGMTGVSSTGQVCPATHHDGSTTDPTALQEGTHVQLDPSVNVDALPIPRWEKTIAHALQTYGMYLRDQGGSLSIWAENPIARGYDAWAKVGLAGDSISLAGIPWNRMRVLAAPPC
jgi:hypothetical protein